MQETRAGRFGSLALGAFGAWVYDAEMDCEIQALDGRSALIGIFTVTNADGITTQLVAVSISGGSALPITTGLADQALVEDFLDYTMGV